MNGAGRGIGASSVSRVVIVGGSDAGISAALRARELDPGSRGRVVLEDAYPNFSICGIPYYVSGDVPDWRSLAHRTFADLEATGMTLRLDTVARRIDADRHEVVVTDGGGAEEALGYDKLIDLSYTPPLGRPLGRDPNSSPGMVARLRRRPPGRRRTRTRLTPATRRCPGRPTTPAASSTSIRRISGSSLRARRGVAVILSPPRTRAPGFTSRVTARATLMYPSRTRGMLSVLKTDNESRTTRAVELVDAWNRRDGPAANVLA